MKQSNAVTVPKPRPMLTVLMAISLCHLINDLIQALLPSMYPILKENLNLTFSQIGMLTLTYQVTASLLQPFIGLVTDRKSLPMLLPIGMVLSCTGILPFVRGHDYVDLVLGAMILGAGSSIFHPEASRIAHSAANGAHGFAQSIFQVGGSLGSSLGPLLAAFLIMSNDNALTGLASVGGIGVFILLGLSKWHFKHHKSQTQTLEIFAPALHLRRKEVLLSISILLTLTFSKFFYLASISNYFTFYLIERFSLSVESAQLYLFFFLAASAIGGFVGGPLGDRVGSRVVIWGSILGALPFTLALPYVGLSATITLIILIGFIISSAFSAIVVFAQSLMPGRIGMVSGLFFGFAFGMGGAGAAILGILADHTNIEFVYSVCSFLPLIGLLAIFLPDIKKKDPQTR